MKTITELLRELLMDHITELREIRKTELNQDKVKEIDKKIEHLQNALFALMPS